MSSVPAGPFDPVTEEITAFDLSVTGRIPAELRGRYLRIGPNALGVEDPAAAHWMHGPGMVHGVRLQDGRAEWYRNRWVRSDHVRRALGEPEKGVRPPYGGDFACNTHVIRHAGRIFALTEGEACPQELTGELDTVGPHSLGGSPPNFTAAAHTKRDPHTGELHSVSYLTGSDTARHLVMDVDGTVTHWRDVPMDGSPMIHDFALTERHVVIYDSPVVFSAEAHAGGARVPFVWDHDRPSRVAVLPRDGGPVRWFEVAPCFVSHTLNAYDDGDRVIVDLVTFPEGFDVDAMRVPGYGGLDRWTIDLTAGHLTEERLDDRPQEFPRVNEEVTSVRHRFGYTVATAALYRRYVPTGERAPDAARENALIKHDLERGTTEVHHLGTHETVGEAAFAPAASGAGEERGYLLAYAHNPERDAADLLVVSAEDFLGEPVARVHLPVRVPLGLHGSWLPD
ncbi:carotenoid oxygenase family protein [Streptomyces spiramenti]|uniref:Dioxygenase n=1 Tax=Streptomyces spiramenti TaxID=2720606 RepID=A0ABX1AC99_9ACTN|nr:carotenoid oxygenase family protein [Streptomyces spiramenti]NJP64823.1 carotenoid oxygenase [Streptomyces spiramenti]